MCISGYFEKRVMDYRVEMKQLTSPLRENVKDIGKKIVGFLRDYGDHLVYVNDSILLCLHIILLTDVMYMGQLRANWVRT